MGSGSSRMGSRPSRPRSDHRSKRNFANFLCGGASTSASSPQAEDPRSGKFVIPTRVHDSLTDSDLRITAKESPFTFSSESSSSSSVNEYLRSSQSIDHGLNESPELLQDAETSYPENYFPERKEVPSLSTASSDLDKSHSKSTCNLASGSSKSEHLEPLLTNLDLVPVSDAADFLRNSASPSSPLRFPHDFSLLESGESSANGTSTTEIHVFDSAPSVSISSPTPDLPREESLIQATSSSGPEFVTEGEMRNGSVLHVDVVSISSNIPPSSTRDISSNEAIRDSRRLFWDAFSRHSTRRHYDSRAILTSPEDNDRLGSHDRWLLDIRDDLFGSSFDHDSVYLHRRRYGSNVRRWHSRSETRERLRGGFHYGRRETTLCPSGLHPNGACSCDSLFMHEESSARASISRIVMLAEALFEVLDEIHRQPVSLSLPMVSLPATESVVNGLPVKTHIKQDGAVSVDDVEQCYICLSEYEEGDRIRVLPCCHEYHVSCVDKWLKEIHGVCPLCRRDICDDTAENAADATT